jgi:hypothetical protein
MPGKMPDKWDLGGFLNITHTLWKAEEPAKKVTLVDRLKQREGTELEGRHRFEFSITLPETVVIPGTNGERGREYHLPPSLMDQNSNASVIYELSAIVRRGSFGTQSQ